MRELVDFKYKGARRDRVECVFPRVDLHPVRSRRVASLAPLPTPIPGPSSRVFTVSLPAPPFIKVCAHCPLGPRDAFNWLCHQRAGQRLRVIRRALFPRGSAGNGCSLSFSSSTREDQLLHLISTRNNLISRLFNMAIWGMSSLTNSEDVCLVWTREGPKELEDDVSCALWGKSCSVSCASDKSSSQC